MSLQSELNKLSQAKRTTNVGTGASQMTHTVIAAVASGDNVLISPPGLAIAIYEILLINNVGAQTAVLKDGSIPLLQLTNWAIGAALFCGFAGNNEPHFIVSAGNALILNLSAGSPVDGFAKYKVIG